MTQVRRRPFLLIALGISVAVHLLIALILRWPFAHPQVKPDVVSIAVMRLRRRMPTPHPPPPVKPRTTPRPASTAHVLAASKPAKNVKGKPLAPRSSSVTPSPAPTPTPFANGCSVPNAVATLVTEPTPPPIAPDVRASAANGVAEIRVVLGPHAKIHASTLVMSSGNPNLDAIALAMAQQATYAPARVACKAVAGRYEFRVKFIAW